MTFGVDFDTRPALTGALVSDLDLLVQSLARRLRTRRGALWYAPAFGSYLPDYLGEGFDDGGLEVAAVAALDLEEDPRVLDATVTVDAVHARAVTLRADVSTTLGPVALVLDATQASGLYPPEIEITPYGVG